MTPELLEAHYQLLDLAPGASLDEVKAARRDLVKIWHPDRFEHDGRLRERCERKLKRINESYDALEKALSDPHFEVATPIDPQFSRCYHCGRAVPEGNTFCAECLEWMSGRPSDVWPSPRRKTPGPWAWAGLAITLLLGIGAAYDSAALAPFLPLVLLFAAVLFIR